MWRYTLRRMAGIPPTTLGVLILTFLIFHVVGDPAEVALGKNATAENLAAFDARHGYDKPLFAGRWVRTRSAPDGLRAGADGIALATPLAAGTWRLRLYGRPAGDAPAVTLALTDGTQAPLTLQRRSGCEEARFAVPAGTRAIALTATGANGWGVDLRRRNTRLLDSQFVHYLRRLATGDWGESTAYGQPVLTVLRQGVGPSLCLTLPILIGGSVLALLLAMVCAVWREQRPDRIILVASTVLMSVNYVVWVLLGQFVLAYRLRLFPIWGFEHWTYLALPVLIGILSGLGRDIRFYRTALLDELHRGYVRTAMAKGLSSRRILFAHVLRNSLIPIVTYVSLSVPFLFTGSLLLESFFGIPGLGGVSLNALNSSDMAVVRAVVVVGALLYQFVNLLTDISYGLLDPRVRLA